MLHEISNSLQNVFTTGSKLLSIGIKSSATDLQLFQEKLEDMSPFYENIDTPV